MHVKLGQNEASFMNDQTIFVKSFYQQSNKAIQFLIQFFGTTFGQKDKQDQEVKIVSLKCKNCKFFVLWN